MAFTFTYSEEPRSGPSLYRLRLVRPDGYYFLTLLYGRLTPQSLIQSATSVTHHFFNWDDWVNGYGNWIIGLRIPAQCGVMAFSFHTSHHWLRDFSWLSCDDDLEPAHKQAPNARSNCFFHMMAKYHSSLLLQLVCGFVFFIPGIRCTFSVGIIFLHIFLICTA
jgi:hypothetical protein